MSASPAHHPRGPRRARRRARGARSRSRRVSTVVVIGGLADARADQPGLADVRSDVLLVATSFQRVVRPACCSGFWLDVRLFLVVEVVVLVARAADRAGAHRSGAGAVPAAPAGDRLRRRAARRADDPRRLPDRLRRAGAGAHGLPTERRRARRASRWRCATRRTCPRSTAPASSRSTRARRAAALALGLTPRAGAALRRPAPGRPARRPAAAQRLHRAAEGRRAGLDPRPAGGVPGRADLRGLATSTTRRCSPAAAAVPVRDDPADADRRPPAGAQPARARRGAGARPAMSRPSSSCAASPRPTASHEVLRGIDLAVRRARGGRADRRVGLGQVDAAALHRPARGDRRRRHLARRRADHRSRAWTRCRSAAGSGSSSRPTTCSRT